MSKLKSINLKVFLIDKNFLEFNGKKSSEVIDIIKDNHLAKLKAEFSDFDANDFLTHSIDGDFETWSYCYNHPKENFYWKLFLPDTLSKSQNFKITEFSFVLFLKYKSEIYCVIGGSGMSVIKKYLDTNFGIDVYQHIAKPKEDILVQLITRGIASNISQKNHIYNLNQTLAETLEYSEFPIKIKLIIRDELKKNEFKKYDLDKNKALLEVGSYFSIRKKINYSELKELIKDIQKIRNNDHYSQLTLFRKIYDDDLLIKLNKHLRVLIVDDILLNITPDKLEYGLNDIIEVVHPSKLEDFYDCNKFEVRFKFSRSKFIEVHDRNVLYLECIKYIYQSVTDIKDKFEIEKKLDLLNILGFKDGNDKLSTYGSFFSHVSAEIEYNRKKYFRIDSQWYYLDDEFIKLMNVDAVDYYSKYKLTLPLLNSWPSGKDEDYYNKSHKKSNYYIFDKRITENIEICDILIIEKDKIYFVHVKNGFNTKMRDLYVQVVLSAKRLSNDLKNNAGSTYFKESIKYYNKFNKTKKIDAKDILQKIKDKKLEVNFVMAFNNTYYKGKTTTQKINLSKSNIAKYSLIQTVKDIQPYFPISVIDISEI